MAMKLELLSTNLVEIINRCLESQDLCKLLHYNSHNPYSSPDIDTSLIAPYAVNERILPFPFDHTYKEDQRSQLHIYYPDLEFKNNSHVEQTVVWFDVVVHKKLWLFKEGSKKLVRPYEIASQIARQFDGAIIRPSSTVGELNFLAMGHVSINEEFDGVRLEAKMTTF